MCDSVLYRQMYHKATADLNQRWYSFASEIFDKECEIEDFKNENHYIRMLNKWLEYRGRQYAVMHQFENMVADKALKNEYGIKMRYDNFRHMDEGDFINVFSGESPSLEGFFRGGA